MLSSIRKDSGFSVLSIILVIVVIISGITAWSFSGEMKSLSSSTSIANVQAQTIINEAANIKLTYDKLLANGANYNNIIFMPKVASTSTQPNILDPVDGIQQPKVNQKFISKGLDGYERTEPYGIWTYSKTFSAAYVGDRFLPDPSILLSGLHDSICQQINFNLYGTTDIPVLSGIALSSFFISGSSLANPNTTAVIGSIFTPETMFRTQGCIRGNNPGENLYYLVLKAV